MKIKNLSKKLQKYVHLNDSAFVIYGSEEALVLFDDSLDALLESECYDFDVREYSAKKNDVDLLDGAFDIGGFRIIDEETFARLHVNLCSKIERYVIQPSKQKWIKKMNRLGKK
ncbi:MAG: hypothetical protein AAGC64_00030 [Bacteroidota bacterium]